MTEIKIVDGVAVPVTPEDIAERSSSAHAAACAIKRAEIEAETSRRLGEGYPHDFGGSWGVQILQTREDDRPNWLAAMTAAQAIVIAGSGEAPFGPIRTEANVNIPVTATEAVTILSAMYAHLAAILAQSWALKDAVAAATDATAVEAIDTATGWPA